MYYYTEFLRAKRALFIVAIIIGIVALIAIGLRLAFLGHRTPQGWVDELSHSPTAHVTRTQLPDGSERTVVDDPAKHSHAVIIRKGSALQMDVTEPSHGNSDSTHITILNGSVYQRSRNGMDHVRVNFDNAGHPLGIIFLASLPLGLICACCLGGVLAKENEGHLELAWTKPFSRERYALGAMATGISAIVLSQVAGVIVTLLLISMFFASRITAGPKDAAEIGIALLGSIAWYAMITGVSASLKRGLGMVIGLGWVIAFVVPQIARATVFASGSVWRAVHEIFQVISYIDPLAYLVFTNRGWDTYSLVRTPALAVLCLALLSAAYLAAALLQWRRLEA